MSIERLSPPVRPSDEAAFDRADAAGVDNAAQIRADLDAGHDYERQPSRGPYRLELGESYPLQSGEHIEIEIHGSKRYVFALKDEDDSHYRVLNIRSATVDELRIYENEPQPEEPPEDQ